MLLLSGRCVLRVSPSVLIFRLSLRLGLVIMMRPLVALLRDGPIAVPLVRLLCLYLSLAFLVRI